MGCPCGAGWQSGRQHASRPSAAQWRPSTGSARRRLWLFCSLVPPRIRTVPVRQSRVLVEHDVAPLVVVADLLHAVTADPACALLALGLAQRVLGRLVGDARALDIGGEERQAVIGHGSLRNSTTQTHGLASQESVPLMDSHRRSNASVASQSISPVKGSVGFPKSTPSAAASASLMSHSRSTRTPVTSSVMRLAQRGMWIAGVHRS